MEEEFTVGGPLKFRLELTNESTSAMVYDSQGVSAGSQLITGPDGKEVPYIDIPRQTFGGTRLLRLGETVVLSNEDDVALYYLFVRPGRYEVQFTGNGLTIIDAREVPLLAHWPRETTLRPTTGITGSVKMTNCLRVPSRYPRTR